MATVSKGRVFVSGETVTPTKLNELVDNATVTGVVDADISASAAIAFGKLAPLDSANIIIGNGSNVATKVAVTGDVTISNAGVTTIGSAKVTPPMLSGAQTGSAPIYGCRAWVNFDGTFTSVTGNSYSRSGTTVTVTRTAHGLSTGNVLVIASATDSGLNTVANTASAEITVVDANSFSFQTSSTGTATGTLTYARGIRGRGNVASVLRHGTGDYTITFSTAMPDANYSFTFGAGADAVIGAPSLSAKSGSAPTSSSIRVVTDNGANQTLTNDIANCCVQIFR